MNLQNVQSEKNFQDIQPITLEGLVTSHFNRTYTILNVFVDDPRTCLQLAEAVFRTMDLEGDLSEKAVYRTLVKQVRRLPNKSQFLAGEPHENVVCWLLKETSELKYADIASLMGMERDQVKVSIAGVRQKLIS